MAGPLIMITPSTPVATMFREEIRTRSPRKQRSAAKHIERRLVRMWKRVTGTMRRPERASILPEGFVLMNAAAARRRSMYLGTA
ncbi:hypothetical protein BC834DRAFT_1038664 [Gloeopeniophorella convolvens]|nr:hypothetical protein BC834DRAFT_1038664 [Gloeopeniophorella convolvens]